MKKVFSSLLILIMVLGLCACGGKNVAKDFPFIGTWASEDMSVFLRISQDGNVKVESVAVRTSTSTINGVTTKNESKTLHKASATWEISDNKFLLNGKNYTPTEENGKYTLVGEKITYTKVGDLDYEIDLEGSGSNDKKKAMDSKEYILGDVLIAEGLELNLAEAGIKEDIRITSSSSGISITSGPSAETGKKYVYLKGTVKNTGNTSVSPAIGGKVYLDDYEFDLNHDVISTSGSPSFEVAPLETSNILLFAQISDEMANTFSEGKIVFGFNDNFSDLVVEEAQYLYHTYITH